METKGLQGMERVEETEGLRGNGVQEIKVGEVDQMETERQQGEEERVKETEVLEENIVEETSKDNSQVSTILLIQFLRFCLSLKGDGKEMQVACILLTPPDGSEAQAEREPML